MITMPMTAAYAQCALVDITDGLYAEVTARITAIELIDPGTAETQAIIALLDGTVMVDVHVDHDVYATCAHLLRVGSRVTLTSEVDLDNDGLFMKAHTMTPAQS